MKPIVFYKNFWKRQPVTGPAIIAGQHYKCVVYKSLDSISTGVISCIAQAQKGEGCDCATVVFEFDPTQTKTLILGENNLCVYDVIQEESESSSSESESSSSESESEVFTETERTIYKVFEARVLAEDSYPNKANE